MNDGLKLNSKGPEFLLDLVYHSADVMRNAGLPPESAKDIAIAIATRIAEQFGGQDIYCPKGTWNGRAPLCLKLEERDWKIYHEYNGTNRHEVCARHGISVSRLYQVLSACRHKIIERRNLTPLPKPAGSGR
ncbi:MAG: Mor transcription activator family protein [Pseudomonadota bacterium]